MSSVDVHIAAGGHGSRLRSYMDQLGYAASFPKHLLPTGGSNGETFLGRVIRQTMQIPDSSTPVVHANDKNFDHITNHYDVPKEIIVEAKPYASFFEPMVNSFTEHERQTIGCAGDFYADICWQGLLSFHGKSRYPVTFVAGYSVAVENGLEYTTNEDQGVVAFKRTQDTEDSALINLGVYVFDPEPRALSVLKHAKTANEEFLAQALIDEGLLGLYVLPTLMFNVNTEETYKKLLEHTRQKIND